MELAKGENGIDKTAFSCKIGGTARSKTTKLTVNSACSELLFRNYFSGKLVFKSCEFRKYCFRELRGVKNAFENFGEEMAIKHEASFSENFGRTNSYFYKIWDVANKIWNKDVGCS